MKLTLTALLSFFILLSAACLYAGDVDYYYITHYDSVNYRTYVYTANLSNHNVYNNVGYVNGNYSDSGFSIKLDGDYYITHYDSINARTYVYTANLSNHNVYNDVGYVNGNYNDSGFSIGLNGDYYITHYDSVNYRTYVYTANLSNHNVYNDVGYVNGNYSDSGFSIGLNGDYYITHYDSVNYRTYVYTANLSNHNVYNDVGYVNGNYSDSGFSIGLNDNYKNIISAGNAFSENWNLGEVNTLYELWDEQQSTSQTVDGKTWSYATGTSTVWNQSVATGGNFKDKFGFEHINLNGNGVTSFDKDDVWKIIGQAGYSASGTLGEDWSLSEVNSLYDLWNTKAIGEINIDGNDWVYGDVDYAQAGAWGEGTSAGDVWIDIYGFKHLNLDGDGLTTYNSSDYEFADAFEALAMAGYNSEIGNAEWSYDDLIALYNLYVDGKNSLDPEAVMVNGEWWYYYDFDPAGHSIGTAWADDGFKYILLGSGVTTKPLPEPMSVSLLLVALAGLIKRKIGK